jgi:tetratricopeptide (TPR) repeat protein
MKTCSPRGDAARALGSLVALCALLSSPAAQAQSQAQAQAQDQAAARALFEDGRRLLKKGQYEEACRTLEAASKLYASPGILLNLGDCFEKVGRTASAWTEFGEAVAVAARTRRNDQVAEAKRRQAAVEPTLTRLTIRVSSEVTGLVVTRDQTDLASAAWGEAIPVDPGTHEIRAEAPGHEPWSTSVVVSAPGQTVAVDVPALTVSPAPPPAPPPREPEAAGTGTAAVFVETPPARPRSHTLDWALVGGGVVLGIAGGVLWDLEASRSQTLPRTASAKDFDSVRSTYDTARTLYYAGIAGVAVGGATAITGALLMTVGRGGARAASTVGAIHASPWAASNGGGVELTGGW